MLKPVNAPAMLAMFASASDCMDRLASTIPTEVVEIVEDEAEQRAGERIDAANLATMRRLLDLGYEPEHVAERFGLTVYEMTRRAGRAVRKRAARTPEGEA